MLLNESITHIYIYDKTLACAEMKSIGSSSIQNTYRYDYNSSVKKM